MARIEREDTDYEHKHDGSSFDHSQQHYWKAQCLSPYFDFSVGGEERGEKNILLVGQEIFRYVEIHSIRFCRLSSI